MERGGHVSLKKPVRESLHVTVARLIHGILGITSNNTVLDTVEKEVTKSQLLKMTTFFSYVQNPYRMPKQIKLPNVSFS